MAVCACEDEPPGGRKKGDAKGRLVDCRDHHLLDKAQGLVPWARGFRALAAYCQPAGDGQAIDSGWR